MSRRALLIGINEYQCGQNLKSCVADTEELLLRLERHKDGAKNYDCVICPDQNSDGQKITRPVFRKLIRDLFDNFDGEIVLYFSGHGVLTEHGGYFCTFDAEADDWGVPMQEVIDTANASAASDVLLLLDCCHSGSIANPRLLQGKPNPLAVIRENMTVIAASREMESAMEGPEHGLFTAALLDALDGGAADHMGNVTAPAIYAYTERRFGAWDQRPIYKSHTHTVNTVRQCEPLIDRLKLRKLVDYFPVANFLYPLDPDYEPEDEHGNVREPIDKEKVEISALFKEYRDAGLLKPTVVGEQLFWTAKRSNTVELTARGREYQWLVANGKI